MKKILLMITGILPVFVCLAQDKDCRRFRSGTFTNANEETGITTLIERTVNTQTETTDGGKSKAVFNLKWINDCSFTLRPTKATLGSHPDWPKNALFTVEITETGENAYKQVSSSSFAGTKITNEIKKMK